MIRPDIRHWDCMPNLNELVQTVAALDPAWMYATIFLITYIENIFPPSPSDVIVVFGGAMAAMEKGNFVIALAAGTLGSTFGFMTMYAAGKWFGAKVLERGKIKFIKLDVLHRLEKWFLKYGYWIIVANRFLSGTRAVVSFFAGISALNFTTTLLLSFISSLVWYGILVYAGYSLGSNWEAVGSYLKSYTEIISSILILALILLMLIFLFKKFRTRKIKS